MDDVAISSFCHPARSSHSRPLNRARCRKSQLSDSRRRGRLMRVTIFGATGMLGKALMRRWSEGSTFEDHGKDEVVGLGSAEADIRVGEQVEQAVARTRPEWIVL